MANLCVYADGELPLAPEPTAKSRAETSDRATTRDKMEPRLAGSPTGRTYSFRWGEIAPNRYTDFVNRSSHLHDAQDRPTNYLQKLHQLTQGN